MIKRIETDLRLRLGLAASVAVLALAISAQAQSDGGQRPGMPPPDGRHRPAGPPPDGEHRPGGHFGGPQFDPMFAEMRFDGKIVKGAPYSAKAVTESIQTLADGARITNKTEATVYRDSEGRTRREQTLSFAGPFAASGEPQELVFINDVVANANYVLDLKNHSARKMQLPPNVPPHEPPMSDRAKVESLGTQVIEGVEAEGTRTTSVIPTGEIGNDRPLEFMTERWNSVELKTPVLIKHKNPRIGEVTYRLTNINRGEQPKSLFDLPAGFTVSEGGPPRGGPPRPGRRPF